MAQIRANNTTTKKASLLRIHNDKQKNINNNIRIALHSSYVHLYTYANTKKKVILALRHRAARNLKAMRIVHIVFLCARC